MRTFSFCLGVLIAISSKSAIAQATTTRDPTKPPVSEQVVAPKVENQTYALQSIIIGRTRRIALINGQLVSVGETIGGAKIIAIERNSVVLSESGRRLTLYLFERGIWN